MTNHPNRAKRQQPEAQHTPGPWRLTEATASVKTWHGATQKSLAIASVYSNDANASLIAAAPDLLAALKEAMNFATDDDGNVWADSTIAKARAAIAKAEGLMTKQQQAQHTPARWKMAEIDTLKGDCNRRHLLDPLWLHCSDAPGSLQMDNADLAAALRDALFDLEWYGVPKSWPALDKRIARCRAVLANAESR